MSNKNNNEDSNNNMLKEKLVIEEFKQRYEQYRMHNENRNKYIHFYFIFYFAFWGLVGFLFNSGVKCFLAKYCISIETFLAFAFIMHAIFGSIFFLSIISFRQIQNLEACTINKIRGFSNCLRTRVKYPMDRKMLCKVITSQTPLIILILILNHISAFLSIFLFCKASKYFWMTIPIIVIAFFWIIYLLFKSIKPKMVTWKYIEERPDCDC